MAREETEIEVIEDEKELEEVKDEVAIKEELEEVKVAVPAGWRPKTNLGKLVVQGKITTIDEVFERGMKIAEYQIIDILVPNLENEIVLIGGTGGKGGGSKRIVSRRTARMHKSGRRFRTSAMIVVGNSNGYVGVGMASGPATKHREVIAKAMNRAKLNIMPIRRGCGSWECNCGTAHSIPTKMTGRCGSVHIELIPAPKGIGLCVSDEVKKYMRLAGIKDVWCKSRGQTSTRFNTLEAIVDAMNKMNKFKIRDDYQKATGSRTGRVE